MSLYCTKKQSNQTAPTLVKYSNGVLLSHNFGFQVLPALLHPLFLRPRHVGRTPFLSYSAKDNTTKRRDGGRNQRQFYS